MGSVVGTVGAKFGLQIPAPPAVSLPTGTSTVVLTQIALPSYQQASATNTYLYVAFEYGWRAFDFQVVPATGFAGTISAQVNVTLDAGTASGLTGSTAWEPAPFPSVGTGSVGWNNPMTAAVSTRTLYLNSGPWAAFQIVFTVTGGPPVGYMLFGAGS